MIFKEDLKHNILEFTIKADQHICNSLRRIMISEVETYAIERVLINKNNSIINDEMLSHRLGLLPLKLKEKEKKKEKEKEKKELLDIEICFTLDVTYDQSQADCNNIHTIYSNSLQTTGINPCCLVNDDIIIAEITKGQSISLVAYAVLGNGLVHAKWSPSCGTSYIDHENGLLTFKIETTGSMRPIDIFDRSIDILVGKIDNLLESLK